jgi:hypothetical protein
MLMKSVTEFWTATLNKGIKAKEALVAAGKSAEEIAAGLGETFKYEGDKLKHFVNAIEVAIANPEKLSRVLVVQLNEGEKVPAKATKIEEHHYVPDFQQEARAVVTTKRDPKAQGPKKDQNRPKTSPWGLTPEEKAAKKGGGKAPKPTT